MSALDRVSRWHRQVHRVVVSEARSIARMTQQIVKIPSVTGEEERCAQTIALWLARLGLDVAVVEASPGRPNVVGVLESGLTGPRLLLMGHTDVAPPGPREDWSYEPFSGHIERGMLHGRGSVDMKSGLASAIGAVKVLRQLGVPWRGSISVAAVCDEAAGGKKGTQYLLEAGLLDADMGIHCGATNLRRIDTARKGVLQVELAVSGRAGHGSRPWLGVNAIDKAADAIKVIRSLHQQIGVREHPVCGSPSLNVGTIVGGTAVSMVPSRCVIGLDRRLIPGETHAQALAEIHASLVMHQKTDPDFSFSLREVVSTPALEVQADSPPVKALLAACTAVNHEPPIVGGQDATSDAAWIVTRQRIPVPVFGPGDYLHCSLAPNESIQIRDIYLAAEIYSLAMLYLLGI